MSPFLIVFLGFSLAVTAVWLRHHFFLLPDNWFAIGLPLVIPLGVSLLLILFQRFRKKLSNIPLPRITILALIIGLSLLIFNVQVFGIGLVPGHSTLVPATDWLSANLSFSLKLAQILLGYFLLTIVLAATGHSVLRRLSERTLLPWGHVFFLRIAIGMSLWAAILVVLGELSILTPAALWLSAIGIALTQWRSVLSMLSWCFKSDHWNFDSRQPLLWIVSFGLFLIALNLTQTIRPQPTGFDDMTYYMDHANQMREAKRLLPGGNPFPFELSAASLGIAAKDQTMMFALSLGVYGLLLATGILFAFGRAIRGTTVGAIASITSLSIPMGPALSLLETKPDAWLFPIAILFFWSLLRWLQFRELEQLLISLFLLGFAISIKLTALFLGAPLLIALGIAYFSHRGRFMFSLRFGMLSALFLLIPLIPWIWLAASTHPGQTPLEALSLLSSYPTIPPALTHEIEMLLEGTQCQPTGSTEIFSRFIVPRGPLASWLFLPWDITMNLTVATFATEIGFLFLAVLPLWLWYRIPAFRSLPSLCTQSPLFQLALFLVGYGLLWSLFAQRILWYGYPAVALASLLTAGIILRVRSVSPHLYRFLLALLVISLVCNTLVRLKFSGPREQLLYASGTLSATDFLDTTFPGLKTIRSAAELPSEPRMYITGSRLRYAINNHAERTFNDPHLDTFECLLTTYGTKGVLEKFRELDIRYVFFSRTLLTNLTNDRSPSFRKKVERFTDFAGHELRIVWGSADYMLFELPPSLVPINNGESS